jgi:hypothetical protein
MKITVFCNVTPCNLENRCQHFGGTCCQNSSTLMKEAAGSSATLTPIYKTTQYHIPEDCNHLCRRENLKFHTETDILITSLSSE